MQSARHHIPEAVLLSPIRQKHQRNEPAVLQPAFGVSSARALMPASASAAPQQRRAAAVTASNDRRLRKMRTAIYTQHKHIAAVQQRHHRRRADRTSAALAQHPRAEFAAKAAEDHSRRPADRAWDTRRYGSQGIALWGQEELRGWYSAGQPASLASAGALPDAGQGMHASTAPASAHLSGAVGASRRLQQYAWAPAFTWAEHGAWSEESSEPHHTGYCVPACTAPIMPAQSIAHEHHAYTSSLQHIVRVPAAPLSASGKALLSPAHPQQLSKSAGRQWTDTQHAVKGLPAAGTQRLAASSTRHWMEWHK